jgi:glycosyltransferase
LEKLLPTVSIITVVYNNQRFIDDAIKSVLNQSYSSIEYIVVDGASTDNTVEIIKKYENKISKCVSEKDEGVYDALNKGIKLSSGDVIGFLHSDDFYADEYVIEKVAAKFNSSDADVFYSDLEYVSRKNKSHTVRHWKAGEFSRNSLKYGWMPPHPAMFVRRLVYNKVGLFDINMKIASDYDMVLKILQSPVKVLYLNEVLVKMRTGGSSNSSIKNILTKSRDDYVVLKKNNFSFPAVSLLLKNLRKLKQFL